MRGGYFSLLCRTRRTSPGRSLDRLGRVCWATSSSNCRLQLSRPLTPRPQAWKRSSNTRRAWLKERALMPPSNRCPAPETVSCALPHPARRASGIGNRDQPRHTTCRGRPTWENPTYSAFWSVFGVTCLRLQRLAASVGSGRMARLAPRKNLPDSGVSSEPGGCYSCQIEMSLTCFAVLSLSPYEFRSRRTRWRETGCQRLL